MYENTPHSPHNQRPGYGLQDPEYRAVSSGGSGWLWIAGLAVVILVGLVFFGAATGPSGTETVDPAATGAVEAPAATGDATAPAAAGGEAPAAPAN
ncbi:hypothetical protein [Pseudoruegeria sp. HB172150]|uniref:hypothetical protein n=1 Tax=Pseudoruegeria sp. HB172150 TaxID=2721164 RepID=UPI001553B536|nr:hypothetical protein [Pseudoruegeria sp. HB172150]